LIQLGGNTMSLGTLVKFYREKNELTQEELGKGICSVSHVSKIERGITQYSSEIMDLLSRRLGINLESELQSLQKYERLLDEWHDSMVMQQESEVERLKEAIEKNSLFLIHPIQNKYFLLQARYYLLKGDLKQAERRLSEMNHQRKELGSYELHLLHHILGMTEIIKGRFKKALEHLLQINEKEYLNNEFYYQIAIAYLNLQFKVKSYHYSELALDYFRKTNNFKRVIDAETVKLISEGRNEFWDFEDLVGRYNKLIVQCDMINEIPKKAVLLSNLAYEYSFAGDYNRATVYYKKTLELLEPETKTHKYLNNLIGYVYCCLQLENNGEDAKLADLIELGRKNAETIQDQSSLLFFQMLSLLQKSKKELYFEFIEEKIIPLLEESGKYQQLLTYEKSMFQHYLDKGNSEKALKYASRFVNKS
jgi:HTH-type transcriptional regulator, quorum sensing regulator NprR